MGHQRTSRRGRLLTGGAAGALALSAFAIVPLSAPAVAAEPSAAAPKLAASAAAAAPANKRFSARNARQLRRAVFRANRSPGVDRIDLRSDIVLNRGGGNGDGVFSGDLEVTDDLRIFARGNTVDLKQRSRLFEVEGADTRLDIFGLTVRNGAPETDGDNGGIFSSEGTLVINRSRLLKGRVTGDAASGGLIFSEGDLVVRNSFLRGGRAVRAGGAIETEGDDTSTIIRNSDLRYNFAGYRAGANPGNGGAFHQTGDGDIAVSGSRVKFNRAALEGGGLWNSTGDMVLRNTRVNKNTAQGDDADTGGGGLFNNGGNLTVASSQLRANKATGESGSGGAVTTVDGGTLAITDARIARNTANRAGGAIEGVGDSTLIDLDSVLLRANTAGAPAANPGNGGALHVTGGDDVSASVMVTNSRVINNVATSEGGGLWNDAGFQMTVRDSTVVGNDARGDDADNGGGGLFNNGGSLLVNRGSLVAENTASGVSGSGGGLFNLAGSLTVTRSAIAENTALRAGGGIEVVAGNVEVNNTDLTGNRTGDNPGNGGGLHSNGGNTTINGGSITGNSASGDSGEGGGVWNGNGNTTVSGTTFDGGEPNTATGDGADAYNNGTGTLEVNGENIPEGEGRDDAQEPTP